MSRSHRIIITISFAFIALVACFYGGYHLGGIDKKCVISDNDSISDTLEISLDEDSIVDNSCYGKYYEDVNNSVIWNLEKDGSFNVSGKEINGVYVIHQNTITFISAKHTTGPVEIDPFYYNPVSYLISKDCSKITFSDGTGLTKVN